MKIALGIGEYLQVVVGVGGVSPPPPSWSPPPPVLLSYYNRVRESRRYKRTKTYHEGSCVDCKCGSKANKD